MSSRPSDLHLVRHREVRWALFPPLAVGVVALAVWIGTRVTGAAEDDDWSTAGPGLSLIVVGGIAVWAMLSIWLTINEKRHANAVLDDAAVDWPQYSTPAQWAKDVDTTVEHLHFDWPQVVGPAVVFSVAAIFIAGVTAATGDAGTALLIGGVALVVIWLGAAMTIGARTLLARRSQARTRERLEALRPFPNCWVAEEGAYFEDTGLVRFHRLSEVRVVEPGDISAHRKELKELALDTGYDTDLTPLDTRLSKSGWAHLAVTSDSTKAHTFWLKVERAMQRHHRGRHDWVDTVHIRVPPDDRYDAHELAARIRRRWLA